MIFVKLAKVRMVDTHTITNPYAIIITIALNLNFIQKKFLDSGNFLLCVLKIHLKVFLLGVLTFEV